MRDPNYTWARKKLMKENDIIKVGVIGASGFTGEVLMGLLFEHPFVEVLAVSSRRLLDKKVSTVFPNLSKNSSISFSSPENRTFNKCDVIFLCTPHGISMSLAEEFLSRKVKVIDLSADFRIKDLEVWEKWYKAEHSSPDLLKEAVYGLPELFGEDIKKANLISVPGCYPTVSLLSIIPSLNLEEEVKSIIIDAKSGMTGAGRSSVNDHLLNEMQDNFRVYGENGHRHYPEIKQIVDSLNKKKVEISFTAQLLPIMRGIYATTYIDFKDSPPLDIHKIYRDYYKSSKNVLVGEKVPDLIEVVNTNSCKIFIQQTSIPTQIQITACIDNLLKGAAGQAVECFNLIFSFEQNTGLN